MQQPQLPYWNPNIPKYDLTYVKNNSRASEIVQAASAVGGVDNYRRLLEDYEKAYAKYTVDYAKYDLENARAKGWTGIGGLEQALADQYQRAASLGLFSAQERSEFSTLAKQYQQQSAATRAVEDRNREFQDKAYDVQRQLLQQSYANRDTEWQRLDAERNRLRDENYAARQYDVEQSRALYKAGLMAKTDFDKIVAVTRDRYDAADEAIDAQWNTAREAVGLRGDRQQAFARQTFGEIAGGNYDPSREYALPDFDYTPATLSSNYKPIYQRPKEGEQTQQPGQPGSAPIIQPPTVSPADPTQPPAQGQSPTTTPTTPSTPPASSTTSSNPPTAGQPSAPPPPQKIDSPAAPKVVRAPRRESSDLVGRARVVDQGGQSSIAQSAAPAPVAAPQQPGLIGGAGLLGYTPTMNAPANNVGLLMNQNPQLYNFGAPGVRLPGQGV